jgi:hypothetical protein
MTTKQYDAYSDLITFTRASTGTYLDSDGLLKTATTNTPRIEYDADGNRRGLLIEEARTNLLINSGDMDGGSWSSFRTTFSNGDTAPDGSQLFLLAETSETNVNGSNAGQQVATLAAGTYTMSAFAKAGPDDAGFLVLRPASNVTFTDTVHAWFNLETGSVGTVSSSAGSSVVTTPVASIQDYGNGVYRCILTFTITSEESIRHLHYIANASGSFPVTLGKQVQLWGAQVEAGSFPTSYISTSGAAASRAADVASIPTSAFGYNQKAGTVVVDCSIDRVANVAGTSIAGLFGSAFDISNSTRVFYRSNGTTGYQNTDGGVTSVDLSPPGVLTAGQNINIAFAYVENDFAVVRNGGTVQTDTSGSLPEHTLLQIGSGQALLNGHIKSIQYYPRRLTNTQLQELTS